MTACSAVRQSDMQEPRTGVATRDFQVASLPQQGLKTPLLGRRYGTSCSDRLHRLEQVGQLDAQAERDAIERFDRRRILAQLDLRQVV